MASNQISSSPLLAAHSAAVKIEKQRSSEKIGNQSGFPGKASSLPELASSSLLGTDSGSTEDSFHYEELPEFRPAQAHMFSYGELGHTRMPSVTKVGTYRAREEERIDGGVRGETSFMREEERSDGRAHLLLLRSLALL